MTILVDDLTDYPETMVGSKAKKHGTRWCHMVSDASLDELHTFAARIGLRLEWGQRGHYDLTPGMREKAVRAGAEEVSSRDLVKRMVGRRRPCRR